MMNEELKTLLRELEAFGLANDANTAERSQRMLNVTRDTGEFLQVLALSTGAKNILEIGTSNGYSTLWLAAAASRLGGSVTTVEMERFKVELAQANFQRAGLSPYIRQVHADAAAFLREAPRAAYDLVFLDSKRSEYVNWRQDLLQVLRPGGLLVIDNAVSHADQMEEFTDALKADSGFVTSLVPVGKGEFLAHRLL